MGRPVMKIVARHKDSRDELEAGAVWENEGEKGTWFSLSPSSETDREAEYPTIRLVLEDEDGEDVTEEYFLNVIDFRRTRKKGEAAPKRCKKKRRSRSESRRRKAQGAPDDDDDVPF